MKIVKNLTINFSKIFSKILTNNQLDVIIIIENKREVNKNENSNYRIRSN